MKKTNAYQEIITRLEDAQINEKKVMVIITSKHLHLSTLLHCFIEVCNHATRCTVRLEVDGLDISELWLTDDCVNAYFEYDDVMVIEYDDTIISFSVE